MSVLSLVYNQEAFVAEAVESVLAQEWPAERLQYVVINDGSTDGTARALDPYRDRVTVIDQENQGMLGALSTVMELMTGDVILGCSGDDVAKPRRVARMVRALQENPDAGLVYSDLEVIDRDGNLLEPSFLDAQGIVPVSGRIRGRLLHGNVMPGASLALRGCLKPLVVPFPEHVAWEDYWIAWVLGGAADVAYVPEVLMRYRSHGQNLTLGHNGRRQALTAAKELPFRRFMLSDVAAGEATAAELLGGIRALWAIAGAAPAHAVRPLLPPSPDEARVPALLAEAYAQADGGDLDGAALACCRVAAVWPFGPALRGLVEELTAAVERPAAAVRAPDRSLVDELGARRFVTFVDASALESWPQLLSAYAERFDADADATLVIHAHPDDAARLSASIPRLIAERGLDGDGAPDMVLASEAGERLRSLAVGVDAALGRSTPFTPAATYGAQEIDALRVLAERVWKAEREGAPVGTTR
ncbi:MAG TPA: glycosyltransferase [Conexibacter sp.]